MTGFSRRLALLAVLGASLISPSAASAAQPAKDGYEVNSMSIVATGNGSMAPPSDQIVPLATRCYYAYWIAQATNVVGAVLFQYKEQVEWCSDGTKILAGTDRWTQPITPIPLTWSYASETLYNLVLNSTKSQVTARARGVFNHTLPPPLSTLIGQSFPMVTIVAKANGTATGTISW